MTIETLVSMVNGTIKEYTNENINHICMDSREVTKGDVFVAIHSGKQYIEDAFHRGAIAIIGEEVCDCPNYIQVKDSIQALGQIGHYIRKQNPIPLIAITGSTGKTTTKNLLYDILSKKYCVLKNEKNQNNHIGLPYTLTKLNPKHEIIITELGMNHLGEISYLSKLCEPDYAIITNIGTAHIGLLGSQENIFKAKMEILDGMDDGYLLVNGDDKYLKKVKAEKVSIKQVKHIVYYDNKTEFDMNIKGKWRHFIFPIPGKHVLMDALLAIHMGIKLEVPILDIQESVANYQPEKGRMNTIRGRYTIIDDAYNASYEAVKGSLQALDKDKHHIIILADMLELGDYSVAFHKKINKILKKIKHKEVLLLGEYTKYIDGIHFHNIDALYQYLTSILKEGDVILIKGSNRFGLMNIVEKLKDMN